jgi:membrane-bound ClpP family serine protease
VPNWKEIGDAIKAAGSPYDIMRRTALSHLSVVSERNVIIYYSGWLQKPELARSGFAGFEINDADKNGFMTAVHGLDRERGLDLVLHTPGGEVAATESLVDYLRSMFDGDIRVIVPQLAMSAGTMIACSSKRIVMGKHSSLGPIDPQFSGIPAHGVIEEFERARREIDANPAAIPIWQPIIAKYPPTLIGECEKAIEWSNEVVRGWLLSGMLKDKPKARSRVNRILRELGDHALTKSHSRHISAAHAEKIGLEIMRLEGNNKLQDAVLTVHHATIHTLTATDAIKIIENHNGTAYISQARVSMPQMAIPLPSMNVPASPPSESGRSRNKRSGSGR